jgi:hypothetical protein
VLFNDRSRTGKHLINNRYFIVMLIIGTIFININCIADRKNSDEEYALRNNVQNYYENMKVWNFDNCWEMWAKEKFVSKSEFINNYKDIRFKINNFKIISISREADKAKVKMWISITMNNENGQEYYYDYWELRGGKWLITDIANADDLETGVKPIDPSKLPWNKP